MYNVLRCFAEKTVEPPSYAIFSFNFAFIISEYAVACVIHPGVDNDHQAGA